jgi:hypothetical protein
MLYPKCPKLLRLPPTVEYLARTDLDVFDLCQFKGEDLVGVSGKLVKIVHPADGATAGSHQFVSYVFGQDVSRRTRADQYLGQERASRSQCERSAFQYLKINGL